MLSNTTEFEVTNENGECAICYNPTMSYVAKLACGHIVHTECLFKHVFGENIKRTCIVCKADLLSTFETVHLRDVFKDVKTCLELVQHPQYLTTPIKTIQTIFPKEMLMNPEDHIVYASLLQYQKTLNIEYITRCDIQHYNMESLQQIVMYVSPSLMPLVHGRTQYGRIYEMLLEFGFITPVIVKLIMDLPTDVLNVVTDEGVSLLALILTCPRQHLLHTGEPSTSSIKKVIKHLIQVVTREVITASNNCVLYWVLILKDNEMLNSLVEPIVIQMVEKLTNDDILKGFPASNMLYEAFRFDVEPLYTYLLQLPIAIQLINGYHDEDRPLIKAMQLWDATSIDAMIINEQHSEISLSGKQVLAQVEKDHKLKSAIFYMIMNMCSEHPLTIKEVSTLVPCGRKMNLLGVILGRPFMKAYCASNVIKSNYLKRLTLDHLCMIHKVATNAHNEQFFEEAYAAKFMNVVIDKVNELNSPWPKYLLEMYDMPMSVVLFDNLEKKIKKPVTC
jgi:hypothetical protein